MTIYRNLYRSQSSSLSKPFLLSSLGYPRELYANILHPWDSLNNSRQEHVYQYLVVSLSCCYGFGELGTEAVVGCTLTFATCLCVHGNCFRFNQLEGNWQCMIYAVKYLRKILFCDQYSSSFWIAFVYKCIVRLTALERSWMRFIALVFTVSWKLSHCFPKNMKSCTSILPSSSAGYIPVPTDTCIIMRKLVKKINHRAMSNSTQTWKELQ